MSGKIVKIKSGKIGRTTNGEEPIQVDVMDNSNPYMARVRTICKVAVRFDDGTKMLCEAKNLEVVGFWD